MLALLTLIPLFLLVLAIPPAFGAVDFTTDKELYHTGDIVTISGTVEYNKKVPFVVIKTASLDSPLADIGQPSPNSDGSFTHSFKLAGNNWNTDGTFTITVVYDGQKAVKTAQYQKEPPKSKPEPKPETKPETKPKPDPAPAKPDTQTPKPDAKPAFETLKLQIPGFPSYEKSPQYYVDRYNSEPEYKSWFDSQFPSHSIKDVVGYKQTHIDGFLSSDESPQSYIDRYNSEPEYKSWFDSQFPDTSIYNVLGYADPVAIPQWIKSTAKQWGEKEISESDFVPAIAFLLENDIIMISEIPNPANNDIPKWVRNSAYWWSQDLITQDEFLNSIKFLIREGLIPAN
ncbi:MAG: hypothetical protein D9C04_04990 [Nitrosopumilus sp. B06]|nr:MAG: hypothetical protein D9C04_04990 [Nitrosopumilus sp. B06]